MMIEYKSLRIFAFSDTHGLHRNLSVPCNLDVAICAGDVESGFGLESLRKFAQWYETVPAPLRFFVIGNHDLSFEFEPLQAKEILQRHHIYLLENNAVVFGGVCFSSIPARPWLHQTMVIAPNTDFLITHGPALEALDAGLGCALLRQAIVDVPPRYHLFGHIHQLGGNEMRKNGVIYANVSAYHTLFP